MQHAKWSAGQLSGHLVEKHVGKSQKKKQIRGRRRHRPARSHAFSLLAKVTSVAYLSVLVGAEFLNGAPFS